MKKIIAYCIIFTMVLSMLPLNAFASDVSVEADKAALDIGYAGGDNAASVTQNLTLTVTGSVYGSDIIWSSDNTAFISNSGVVTRPSYVSGDAAVTLTAAITFGEASDTKEFNLTVLKLTEAESDFNFDPVTGTITGYTGAGGTVEIPSTIGGVPVTAIGDNAFCNNKTITDVIIPDGVLSIGESAFDTCSNLESVTLPDGLTSIERCAFYWCIKLKSITLPDSLTSVGSGMFMGCFELESVNIPTGITELPESIFVYCESLKSVTIPDNIVSIGDGAFQNCKSLRTVKLPANLTSVGDSAFYYCQQLAQAVFTGNSPTSFGANVFNDVKDSFMIFYSSDSTGFSSPTWNGYPSEQYNPAATYTLTYDANGGATDFPTVDSLHTGDCVIISNNNDSLVKDGHKFSGWNTSADGTGDKYTEGSTVLIGVENVTLYAQWKPLYSVVFDTLEHGSISVDKSTAQEGDIITLTITGDEGWNYKPYTLKFKNPATGVDITDDMQPTPPPYISSVVPYEMPASDILVSAELVECDYLYQTTTDGSIKITEYIGKGGNIVIPSTIEGKNVTVLGSEMFFMNRVVTGIRIPNTVTTLEGVVFLGGGDIKKIIFEGDAPVLKGKDPFAGTHDVTIYYTEGAAGFTTPIWYGYATVALPRNTSLVTFDKNGGNTESNPTTIAVVTGETAGTLPSAPTRSGYSFTGWNTAADGTGTAFTTTTTVNANITVYAQWTVKLSGGDGTTTVTPVTPSVPPATISETPSTGNAPPSVTATTNTEAKADSNGNAAASVTESQMTDVINKAVEAAAQKGGNTQAKVEIKVTAPADAKSVETSIPKVAFATVADGKTDELTVSTPIAAITFDKEALDTIAGEAAADVKISVAKVGTDTLSQETKQLVGDRPVYNFSVTSGHKTISQFGGNVTVSVPYTPKEGEDINAIVIYYINAEGKAEMVSNCKYDSATGRITFTTNHFSMYAVGYNKVSFKDVAANEWYSNAVGFVAARGITTGTGDGYYSPEGKLTRGQFLVMVMRAYGIAADENAKDNFADAGSTYYTGYLAAAKRLEITAGIGNNLFAPEKEITRQEMLTMLYNTLKQRGELPATTTGETLADFTDAGQVASWAKDAMALFVETGTVSGSGNMLNLTGLTTRAEIAQVLYNLMSK